MKKINIGLIGLGTIGEGVYKILNSRRSEIKKSYGLELNIKSCCDISPNIAKKLKIKKEYFTNNYNDIVFSKDIDVVIELIGGLKISKDIAIKTLQNNKHFITANKALIAENGTELKKIAKKNNVKILYEASVGGGIPILNSIQDFISINKIKSFYGILNGTCNYILTLMSQGIEFNDALEKAQKSGFAEADPTLDINGMDTAHKVVVLANECFGYNAKVKDLHISGINNISKIDLEIAKNLNCKIKLIGIGKVVKNSIDLRIHLVMINQSNPLANVDNELNAVLIDSENLGKTMKYGFGAGMLPTATSVISDIVRIGNQKEHNFIEKKYKNLNISNLNRKFYIRLNLENKAGNLAKITSKFAKYKINIEKIFQNPENVNSKYVPVIIISKKSNYKVINNLLSQFDKLSITNKKSLLIPFEE